MRSENRGQQTRSVPRRSDAEGLGTAVRIALIVSGVVVVGWLLGSHAAAAGQGEYRVGPQDVLTVVVYGRQELSGKFIVDTDGTVQLPLIERVKVTGLTLRAIEDELEKRLADGYLRNPQVTASVEQYRSQRVFVQGEVREAGAYPLSGPTSLLEVLTRAGSVTADAGHEVIIYRQAAGHTAVEPLQPERGAGADSLHVDLSELLSGSLSQNVSVRDGDTIVVPRGDKVYITGQVRSVGAYTIRKGTTVLQALTLAGGVTDRGAQNRTKIRRQIDGKQKEIDAKPDDIVKPGDTIVVPERFF